MTEHNRLGFNTGVIATPTDSNIAECYDVIECHSPSCTECTDTYDDGSFDLIARDSSYAETSLLDVTEELTEQHLELLPLRLYGYALKHRRWYAFDVLNCSEPLCLQDTNAANTAFKDLVLPPAHKKMVRALVSHHVRGFHGSTGTVQAKKQTTDGIVSSFDLIHGKGRGLVLLLHGVPGVGKTSTAESVATQLKRPLLPITCGDLGTTASEVENNLETYFELGSKWGCVLLLDEADVFMAKRTTGDFERNALVSSKYHP